MYLTTHSYISPTKFVVYLISLFSIYSIHLIADEQKLRFEHLSVENGLSQSVVTSILKDNKGFLWIGTEDGLNRYDGYRFEIYKYNPIDQSSLTDNGIMCLFKDNNNQLWIGTDKGGVNKYNNETGKFEQLKYDKEFQECKATSICNDDLGNLWIGTDRGLYLYNTKSKSMRRFTHNTSDNSTISNNFIRAVYLDKNGDIWIGTDNGLNRFDKISRKFLRYFFQQDKNKRTYISSIFEDRSGKLWISTFSSGIICFNKSRERISYFKNDPADKYSLSSNDVRKVFEDSRGEIWIGTANGLNRLRNNKFIKYVLDESDNSSLSNNEVISIYECEEGILLFGTFGGGINKLNLNQESFFHYKNENQNKNSLSENFVTAICEDDLGNLWVGTNFRGLNRIEKKTGNITHYINTIGCTNCISQNTIISLYYSKGTVWIGTYLNGLNCYDIKNKKFTNFPVDNGGSSDGTNSETIYAIARDKNNFIWLATRNGLTRYDPEKKMFKHYSTHDGLSDNIVQSLLCDSDGFLWLGTIRGGLNRFDPSTEKFIRYRNDPKNSNSIISNRVLCISNDPANKDYLLIGTNNGFERFNKKGKSFEHFSESIGLNNVSVYGILPENSNLWLCTSKGIARFNVNNLSIRYFNEKDGLQGIEFEKNALLKSSDGMFYLGGPKGMNAFDPDAININISIPPIVLTAIKIFNKEFTFDKSLDFINTIPLKYNENMISFEFASLSFTSPENNHYAYLLEGFDKEWTYTNAEKRFASYTNLQPGEYRFRVKGSNNDGIWNTRGVSIKVIVSPPYWEHNLFRISSGVIFLSIIFLLVRQKTKKINRERMQQYQFSKKLIESQEEERKRLSKELHDSIGQNLLVIKNWMTIYKNTPSKDKQEFEKIEEIVTESLNEVKEISSSLHPHQLERLGFKKAVTAMIKKVSNSFNIDIEHSIEDIADLIPKEAEINIYRILQESLNNIIKHSGSAKATIGIKKEVNKIIISIEDFGKGFDPNAYDMQLRLSDGFGLKSMNERVRLLNGEIQINSVPGKGTQISISIPTGK